MMDSTAFTQQLIPYSRKLFAVAFRITGSSSEAEDVVQDVYLKLWQMRDTLPEASVMEAFLVKMTQNRSIDRLRTRHIDDAPDEMLMSVADGEPDSSLQERIEDRDALGHLNRLMESLPEAQRKLLRLRMAGDLTTAQLATALGKSEGNVRVMLARARKHLKELAIKNHIL